MVRKALAPVLLVLAIVILIGAHAQKRFATPDLDDAAVATGSRSDHRPGVLVEARTVEVLPEFLIDDPAGGALRPIAPTGEAMAPEVGTEARVVGSPETRPKTAAPSPRSRTTPSSPARPTRREFTIPAGTPLPIVLESRLSSDKHRNGPITATLRHPLIVAGTVAVPEGSVLSGTITEARRAGRVRGRARVAFSFHTLRTPDGTAHRIRTRPAARTAPSDWKRDARAAAPAAAGGALAGMATAVHPAIGAGAVATVAIARRGAEVSIRPGTAMTVRLQDPLTVPGGSRESPTAAAPRQRPPATGSRRTEAVPLRIPGTVSLGR
jgi:hypothetical protein